MRKHYRFCALALGAALSLSVFTACAENGTPDLPSGDGAVSARICFDNLDGGYLSDSDTKIAVADAQNIAGFDADGVRVADYAQIAEYSDGVFTAKSAGHVTYTANGETGNIQVVPAYATDPKNQYTGKKDQDTSLVNGAKYLGNTHDPSFIEVEEYGASTYYLFSTGWNTGNDIHVSYDNMITWEYVGKTTHTTDISNGAVIPEDLKNWLGAKDNSGDIQWWAPDVVAAPDGGYWLYTCCVAANDQAKSSGSASFTPSCDYSMACIVLYHTDSLDKNWKLNSNSFEYVGLLMQSAIPRSGGDIDVNSIDPQIVYDTDGKMYMAYGSFGTGNWMLELDPQTGLRKDGVYSDGVYKDWTEIRRERNRVVSGDAEVMNGTKYRDDFLAGVEVKSDFYGAMISLGAMEAPVLARHDGVKIADETAEWKDGEPVGVSGKTYYYSMHSYNWLESNYQMWGGRSESVWGVYKSVNGGLVYNIDVGASGNQGNKYMGGFKWRDGSKAEGCTEFDIVLPGHNDLYTAKNGAHYAAYITRTFDYAGESFAVQVHQYYLNSMGDICINPNRFGGEIERGVTKEELLRYTDGGRFEMVVLTNAQDAAIQSPGNNAKLLSINNESFEVVLTYNGKITRGGVEIGDWLMYGKGYIKFMFHETLKGTGVYDSGETVYYGVVRPSWLGNRNQSGFTISCLGHGGEKQNMAMFMNSYSNISL